MRFLILTHLFLLLFNTQLQAQNWEFQFSAIVDPISTENLPENNWNGLSLSANYQKDIFVKSSLFGGLFFHSNSWANHTFLSFGISYELASSKKYALHANYYMNHGIALFSERPLYSHLSKLMIYNDFKINETKHLGLGIGVQYITTPRYSDYSLLHSRVNFPISIRFLF